MDLTLGPRPLEQPSKRKSRGLKLDRLFGAGRGGLGSSTRHDAYQDYDCGLRALPWHIQEQIVELAGSLKKKIRIETYFFDDSVIENPTEDCIKNLRKFFRSKSRGQKIDRHVMFSFAEPFFRSDNELPPRHPLAIFQTCRDYWDLIHFFYQRNTFEIKPNWKPFHRYEYLPSDQYHHVRTIRDLDLMGVSNKLITGLPEVVRQRQIYKPVVLTDLTNLKRLKLRTHPEAFGLRTWLEGALDHHPYLEELYLMATGYPTDSKDEAFVDCTAALQKPTLEDILYKLLPVFYVREPRPELVYERHQNLMLMILLPILVDHRYENLIRENKKYRRDERLTRENKTDLVAVYQAIVKLLRDIGPHWDLEAEQGRLLAQKRNKAAQALAPAH